MCEHFDKDYDDNYEEDENLDDDCEMEKRKLYCLLYTSRCV